MMDWISHKIKKPIDLTKVDESFFRGGLATPIIEEEIPFEPIDLDESIDDDMEDEDIYYEED